MPDYISYQKSIASELLSEKDRVRNIIGSAHYGEDGRYKEIILREIIAKKLPSYASVGTGFVAGDGLSSQIDIIIYKDGIPLIFKEADFVIAAKEAVLAIIEVKTKWNDSDFEEIFEKAHNNGIIVGPRIFNGLFFYDIDHQFRRVPASISRACNRWHGYVNNVSFGPDFFMKYWDDGFPNGDEGQKYRFYKIEHLSFGYFISNLIEDVHILYNDTSLPSSLHNYMYPLEETKEAYAMDTIPVH